MNGVTILYAPLPVEMCFTLELHEFARLDARFTQSSLKSADLRLLVQDSAALLNAHLTLHTPDAEYHGHPGGQSPPRTLHLEEWRLHLGLDTVPITPLGAASMDTACQAAAGMVYTFRGTDVNRLQLLRHYALSDWYDRLELEFLREEGFPGVDFIHGHTLGASGRLSAWSHQTAPIRGSQQTVLTS